MDLRHHVLMASDWARLGRLLGDARKTRGTSQIDLADQLSVSRATVQKIERGSEPARGVPTPTYRQMARAVGWTEGSVELVLAGGEPVLAEREDHGPPGEPGGELDSALEALSERVKLALLGGQVVDSDVIDLAPDDPDSVAVLILKRGARPGATREEMTADLQKWARLQRAARQIFSDDQSATDVD